MYGDTLWLTGKSLKNKNKIFLCVSVCVCGCVLSFSAWVSIISSSGVTSYLKKGKKKSLRFPLLLQYTELLERNSWGRFNCTLEWKFPPCRTRTQWQLFVSYFPLGLGLKVAETILFYRVEQEDVGRDEIDWSVGRSNRFRELQKKTKRVHHNKKQLNRSLRDPTLLEAILGSIGGVGRRNKFSLLSAAAAEYYYISIYTTRR